MLLVRTELSSVSCVELGRVSIGVENCDVTLPWQQNFWITAMGDLPGTTVTATSTAKKEEVYISKTTTLHVHHAFL